MTVTATDNATNSASADFTVLVRDTTAPVLSVPSTLVVTCSAPAPDGRACAKATDSQVAGWLASATATDLVDAAPTITHNAPAVLPIGFTAVTFRAVDNAGNSVEKTAQVQVVYMFGGFEAPLLQNGSASIQKGNSGRTIPVKFTLTCSSGVPMTTAVATSAVYKVLDAATGTVDTTNLTSDAGSSNGGTNLFRHVGNSQYVYNLSTRGWPAPATYRIIVTLDDGTQHTVDVSLR